MRRRSFLAGAAALATGPTYAAEAAMADERFWTIVDATTAFQANPDRQIEVLTAGLRRLGDSDLRGFDQAFRGQLRRAYRWDLWGAGYLMNGGASDDGFDYFCCWLIARGRKAFEVGLAEPDALAELELPRGPNRMFEFEEFGAVSPTLMEERGVAPSAPEPWPREPAGRPFREDELATRYPRLSRRYGGLRRLF